MKFKRFKEPVRYDVPDHRGFIGLRLQGYERDGPKNQWVGISHFLPGAVPARIRQRGRRSTSVSLAA
jgi:hypothetical protein